ncbi:MFS transporter [Nitrospira sp.]|nr:MFS transporter [Nitrospira sp.]
MHQLINRIVNVERPELRALLFSFLYFFTLLASYYVLRPVRDEMGVQTGAQRLPWLFSAVFLCMVVLVPIFGWIAGRLPVRRLIPTVYLFFAGNLLLFFLALNSSIPLADIAPVFFVWVSVFNLFVVSVFWSVMADLYTTEAARRLFGFIAAGGSCGAVAGPLFTAIMVPHMGIAPLLLVSISLLLCAMLCFFSVVRTHPRHVNDSERQATNVAQSTPEPPSLLVGMTKIFQSRYLLAICLYLACYSILSTMLYSQQMRLVPEVVADSADRTRLFAWVDFGVNALTVLTQLVLTGRLLSSLGVTAMLAAVPAFNLFGFTIFGIAPILAVLVVFGILRRAGEFAIAKPSRETLFTVVTREEKYQAKNVIDTVVHRGGDMASSWVSSALQSAGLTIGESAFAAVPIAGLWLMNGLYLGAQHERLRARRPSADAAPSAPA